MEKAEEMLVNSPLSQKIYLVKAKPIKDKPGLVECVGKKKIDMTDNAINCVFKWFIQKLENPDNKAENNYAIKNDTDKYTLWMLPIDVYEKLIAQQEKSCLSR